MKRCQSRFYQLVTICMTCLIICLSLEVNTYADDSSQNVASTASISEVSSSDQSSNNDQQPAISDESTATKPTKNTEGQANSQENTLGATSTDNSNKAEAATPTPTGNSVTVTQSVSSSPTETGVATSSKNSQSTDSSTESTIDPSSSSMSTATSSSTQNTQESTTDTTNKSNTSLSASSSSALNADSSDNKATAGDTNKDQITVSETASSTDPAIKQSSNNQLINWLTNITSGSAAALAYPFITSRQFSHLLSEFRTLLSPTRYNVDQTWSDLDQKYNPDYTKKFYTEAQNWYDHEVTKQTLTVPFADGTGTASATYIAHPGSTKTIIYGQGWTTEPEWMGYISKIFYDMGYNVLMPYTRGQNSSDGEFITFGYKDKGDWINWINKVDQLNGPNSEDILYGQSLGADDALQASAQKNLPSSVKAVIADCGYSTIPSLLYSLYTGAANKLNNYASKIGWNLNGSIPLIPYDQFLSNLNKVNYLLQGFNLDDASGISAVQSSTLPTLFIATADDSFIPDSETKALYNASNSKYKQLWILDGHVGGHASANNAVLAYKQHIQNFLNAVENGQTTPANTASTIVNTQNTAA